MQNLRVFRNTVVGNQSEGISIKSHGSHCPSEENTALSHFKRTYLLISLNGKEKFS